MYVARPLSLSIYIYIYTHKCMHIYIYIYYIYIYIYICKSDSLCSLCQHCCEVCRHVGPDEVCAQRPTRIATIAVRHHSAATPLLNKLHERHQS